MKVSMREDIVFFSSFFFALKKGRSEVGKLIVSLFPLPRCLLCLSSRPPLLFLRNLHLMSGVLSHPHRKKGRGEQRKAKTASHCVKGAEDKQTFEQLLT
mmetsp:Transcript_46379/g.91504  ORF Transcript_46379/g.91504 Transcript_46379/m.91504 type:complete len:99 (+) Transcript_46379:569-865(+)